LILPWVRIKNLASHILSQSLHLLKKDWKEKFGFEPKLVETFIDSERYSGTCYLASNFKYIGETKGYGKHGKRFEYHGNKKKVFLYELDKGFVNSIAPHLRRTVRPEMPEKPKRWESTKMLMNAMEWHRDILDEIRVNSKNVETIAALFQEYIDSFDCCLTNSAQANHFKMYIMGLLSNLERKSIEPIALNFGDYDQVRLHQRFMKSSTWKDDQALRICHDKLSEILADKDGVITQ
jgi:hypothetical protein